MDLTGPVKATRNIGDNDQQRETEGNQQGGFRAKKLVQDTNSDKKLRQLSALFAAEQNIVSAGGVIILI